MLESLQLPTTLGEYLFYLELIVIFASIILVVLSRLTSGLKIGCLRILEIPESYLLEQRNHNPHNLPEPLPPENPEARGLIQAMVARGERFASLTTFSRGNGEILFLVQGGRQTADYLGSIYESRIPGLKTQTADRINIHISNPHIIHLDGRARPLTETPLEAVYEQMVQRELNGLIYVHVKPHHPLHEKILLFRKRRLFEELAQKRSHNPQMSTRERRLQLEIEHGLVRMGVYIVASGKTREESKINAETLVGALALGLENPRHIKKASGRRAQRLLEKLLSLSCPAPISISRWEASNLLQLPRREVGVRIRKTATFSQTPTPPRTPSLPVGSLMRDGRKLEREVGLELRYLNSHMLVVGATKAGKSSLMLHLCIKLHQLGIPFVVLEPIKQEYRSLLNLMDLNIFTAGDETLCPIRLNPLEVTEGVQVGTHISNLVEIFRYVFHLWPPLPELLRMALVQTYRKKGWDIRRNIRGQTPNLIDLCKEMEEIAHESGYEDKVKHNILAAFITRMRSLTIDNLGEMLVPKKGTPFKLLLEKPTIFELQNLGGDDMVLVASLLLNWIYENQRVQRKEGGGQNSADLICIIEEAHRIVGNRKGSFGEEDSRVGEFSNRILSQLLSEARGYGLGVALVDQYPGRLPEDAIKNTHTKFLLQLPDEEDRRRMGQSMGLDEEQMRAILDFETGVTVLWNQGEPVKQVKTPNLEELGYNLKPVSDHKVREHMEPLYQIYGWREHNPLVDVMPSEIYAQHRKEKNQKENAAKETSEKKLYATIVGVVNSSKFSETYRKLNQPPYLELKNFLTKTAENIANYHKTPEAKERILDTLQKLASEKHPQRK
ncbi:MAG: ATP-binding protein [Candidatus Freyarchaeota archaeon]